MPCGMAPFFARDCGSPCPSTVPARDRSGRLCSLPPPVPVRWLANQFRNSDACQIVDLQIWNDWEWWKATIVRLRHDRPLRALMLAVRAGPLANPKRSSVV